MLDLTALKPLINPNPLGATAKNPAQNQAVPSNSLRAGQTAAQSKIFPTNPTNAYSGSAGTTQQIIRPSNPAAAYQGGNAAQNYVTPQNSPLNTMNAKPAAPAVSGTGSITPPPAPQVASAQASAPQAKPYSAPAAQPQGQVFQGLSPQQLSAMQGGSNAAAQPSAPAASPAAPAASAAPAPSGAQASGAQQNPQFSPNSGLYGQLIAALANAPQNSTAYQDAMGKYNSINDQLAQSKAAEANSLAANSSNPIPLEFQQGRGQVLQNQYLGQQNALSGQLQGASNVLSSANANQGLLQQALQQAGSLAAPQFPGYGTQIYNPSTNQFGNALGANGQPYDASASAFQGGAIQKQMALGGDSVVQNEAFQSANNQAQQLASVISNQGINPVAINEVNGILQAFSGNVSDPKYQLLHNYLQGISQSFGSILGTSPDIEKLATSSGQSIMQVIDGLKNQAQAQISATKNAGGAASSQSDPLGIL